jgi:tetratricopeptide (TPR) repeat protein
MKAEITPPREKIPIKGILSHIDKISKSELTSAKSSAPKKKEKKQSESPSDTKLSIDEEMLKNRIDKIKAFGKELFAEGAYLEAQKQFEFAEKILLRLGRKEEALEFSGLKINIKELAEQRDKKLELLEVEKTGKNSISIFELYNDLIELSSRLKDVDMASMYQSELIQIFQTDEARLKDLEYQRFKLYKEANLLMDEKVFEKSAEIYEKCENISLFLVELGSLNETINVEKFRYMINECLTKASQLNNTGSEL